MRWNLISLSKLDSSGFKFTFANEKFELFLVSKFIGIGLLCDGLYRLNVILRNDFSSMHVDGIVLKK